MKTTKKRTKLTLSEVETQMEVLTREEMNQLKGGLDDIIVLFDTNAAFGFGHAAVLIGDEISGWRYLSVNGTGEGKPRLWGENVNPDLGSTLHFGSWQSVVNIYNNDMHHHKYDKYVRIRTTCDENNRAFLAAFSQAFGSGYSATAGASCVDVAQKAINAVFGSFVGGDSILAPNNYYKYLLESKLDNLEYGSIY